MDLYDYQLPDHRVAKAPVTPRDSSKLFVYDTTQDVIQFAHFRDLPSFLPGDSFFVMNKTQVLPARVNLAREKGTVTVLFLMNEPFHDGLIRGMVDRKINMGERLFADPEHSFTVKSQDENIFSFHLEFPQEDLFTLFERHGFMPLPPYLLKDNPLSEGERREKYQTIFATDPGSIAAPTASLHFTEQVFENLKQKRIPHFFLTLHVGMGTFAPVTDEQITEKKLHQEWYASDHVDQIRQMKTQGKKLCAVGTTTVRSLESIWQSDLVKGSTDLFIMPPFDFKAVDLMVTNFHLPKSSLMMLVEAFLQHKKSKRHLRELYEIAIEKEFRFFSFGDAMLVM